jgi:hypothetical protein
MHLSNDLNLLDLILRILLSMFQLNHDFSPMFAKINYIHDGELL